MGLVPMPEDMFAYMEGVANGQISGDKILGSRRDMKDASLDCRQAFEQHNFKNVTLITESRRTVVPGMNSSERPPSVTE